jgi:uncharacterized protein (DUF4415 family)
MSKTSNNTPIKSASNWQAAAAQADDTLEISDFQWEHAVLLPRKKIAKTLRLDADMLHWFQQQGQGYQTLINSVLCAYYKAHTNSTPRPS